MNQHTIKPHLVYVTNIWSHHQVPLVTALAELLGEERFRLLLTEPINDERLHLGWQDAAEKPNWVLGPPGDEAEQRQVIRICLDADVAIMGYGPIEKRVRAGKLTLIMGERLLKKPWHRLRMLNPRYARGIHRFRESANHPNVYALTIGHYAPEDLQMMRAFKDRMFSWGYFVDVNPNPPTERPDRPLRILWVGRMLKWKRLDLLLRALQRVQTAPWFGDCRIVGEGPERARLLRLSERLGLDPSRVRMHPPVPFQEVRTLMRDSDACVLTSNRHEGWGAVSGEAMSEGCLLVANQEAGSARVLVEDGVTGFLFRDQSVDSLVEQLNRLALDSLLRERVRRQAWEQTQKLWHPRVAAERLVALCEGLLGSSVMPSFSEGPCKHIGRSTGASNGT